METGAGFVYMEDSMSNGLKNKKTYYGLMLAMVFIFSSPGAFAANVTLEWDQPATNADGTPLTDLSGYIIYYGAESGKYSQGLDVGNVLMYTIYDLFSDSSYYFAVAAYDSSGNESDFSNEISVTGMRDTTSPVISGVYAHDITTDSASINWTTDEASDSLVEYGIFTSHENASPPDPAPVFNHNMTLSGLLPATRYLFRVSSQDSSGNLSVSDDYTFVTPNLQNSPPVISSFKADPYSGRAPLTVAFTVNVSDIDGNITGYEWDFDGNGKIDAATTTNQISHTYRHSKRYSPRVRVIDDQGGKAESRTKISVYK
ncbi:MAG: hypothetical protein C4526_11360 [Nitrospiraceae bacterium]|nr:MAG: hypothetical protein C4526_11360 [Nitrospiraceae bacterium]